MEIGYVKPLCVLTYQERRNVKKGTAYQNVWVGWMWLMYALGNKERVVADALLKPGQMKLAAVAVASFVTVTFATLVRASTV